LKLANGFHGSDAEWERLEKPLGRLDETLEQFAKRQALTLIKNERNWPDRTFRWGERPSMLIQIFLESVTGPSYTVWVSAYDDRSRAEYWEQKTLLKASSIEQLVQELPQLLSEAVLTVEKWEKAYAAG
jgi:hypothetical protein